MRNIIYIILIGFILGVSCSEKLDVEPGNYQDIEQTLSTAEGLNYLNSGAYSYARRAYTRYFFHFAEMLADTGEIYFIGTFSQFRDLQNKSLYATFTWAQSAWSDAYTAINNANLVIDHIDVVEDSARALNIEAHARFIRALMYFDLVRFYALPYGDNAMANLAIPLVTKGVKSPKDITYPSKATVAAVLGQVEEDLLFALDNLPEDEAFFASSYSAAAILSRLYLTTEDFENAAYYADMVIESGAFRLSETFFGAFNHESNSFEDVFMWQQTALDNEGEFNDGIVPFYASTDEAGRSDMEISESFIEAVYDSIDARGMIQYDVETAAKISEIFYIGFGQQSYGGVYCAKWLNHKANVTMVRLAEMHLTRAEANQMLIDASEEQVGESTPAEDINTIRNRAGLISSETVVTIDEIRLERYKELIFEGHRLHDSKRWRATIDGLPFNSESLIVPIPKRETDANPNLK